MTGKLKIMKASAGSGKTYSLARKYISLLLENPDRYAYSHILAVTFTNKATDETTGELTNPLSGQLPPHNIKDKEIYKSHYISIEKLESMLFEDCEWQSSILTRLSMAITSDVLTDYLKTFFAYQKKKGVKSRAIEDVKIHFQNWLSKKLENNNGYGNNEQKESDPRRGTEIQAASAEDYKHTI